MLFRTRTNRVFGTHHISRRSSSRSKEDRRMNDWPTTKDLMSQRGFLGLTRYYRRFVKNYHIEEEV